MLDKQLSYNHTNLLSPSYMDHWFHWTLIEVLPALLDWSIIGWTILLLALINLETEDNIMWKKTHLTQEINMKTLWVMVFFMLEDWGNIFSFLFFGRNPTLIPIFQHFTSFPLLSCDSKGNNTQNHKKQQKEFSLLIKQESQCIVFSHWLFLQVSSETSLSIW